MELRPTRLSCTHVTYGPWDQGLPTSMGLQSVSLRRPHIFTLQTIFKNNILFFKNIKRFHNFKTTFPWYKIICNENRLFFKSNFRFFLVFYKQVLKL